MINYTDEEKLIAFDFLMTSREQSRQQLGQLINKYEDLAAGHAQVPAEQVLSDLMRLYAASYSSKAGNKKK